MPSAIACVLHLEPRSESLRYRWYREPLGSRPALAWWVERVAAMAGAGSLYVVCHGERERGELAEILAGTNARVVDTPHYGERKSLAELARATAEPVWAVLPAGFALAPRDLLQRVHRSHRSSGSTFTWVQGMPQGTAPALFDRDVLLAMDACDLPGLPLPVVAAASRLLQLAHAGAESPVPLRGQPFIVGAADACWPRALPLDGAGGIELLRRIAPLLDDAGGDGGFRLWKQEATRERAARLAEYQAVLAPPPDPGPASAAAGAPPDGRRHVLYVSNPSAFSGAEQSLCQMLAHVDSRRFHRTALVALDGRFVDQLRQAGASVVVRGSEFGRMSVENALYASALLRRLRPDLVHLNAPDGLPLVAAAKSMGIPVVLHVRNGQLAQYDEFAGAADAVIAISDFLKREMLGFDIAAERVHRIYNEVDAEVFRAGRIDREAARRDLGIPAGARVALMIARVAPNKRHDLFLEAAARARAAVRNLHLVLKADVFSQAEADLYAAIRERAQRLGLADAITWLRFVPDIRVLHALADVLVLCSDREGLGRCVVEAMAMELPVVVTDSGGTHELVGDDERGYVAKGGDAADLARKLVQALIGDSRERVQRARAWVEAELDARISARRMMDIYDRLLAPAPPAIG